MDRISPLSHSADANRHSRAPASAPALAEAVPPARRDRIALADRGEPPAAQADATQLIHDESTKLSLEVSSSVRRLLLDSARSGSDCSPLRAPEQRQRHSQWLATAAGIEAKGLPLTVIGVLGGTGVGKSSLLNALLNESEILPTSGSRGCTATVVELQYNGALKAAAHTEGVKKEVEVYSGCVEFMGKGDWHAELEILVSEVCTLETGCVYARKPTEDGVSLDSWLKLEQVYGKFCLNPFLGCEKARVLSHFQSDARVNKLLTPPAGATFSTETVTQGLVESGSAMAHALATGDLSKDLQRQKSRWAKKFRDQINEFVYLKGSRDRPQTWPLIRKVVLKGPWPVLSTGACLVDLPGVKDSNAARANVAASYLRNCSGIWIAAPIKRAVDDKTAKDLLGDEFKRRLLMDGRYDRVSFVCTATDDCEPTEVRRENDEQMKAVPGRYELIEGLFERLEELEEKDATLEQEKVEREEREEDAEAQYARVADEVDEKRARLEEQRAERVPCFARVNLKVTAAGIAVCVRGVRTDRERLSELDAEVVEAERECERANAEVGAAREAVKTAKRQYQREKQRLDKERSELQRKLKASCAKVRNEWSARELQRHFREGLEEMLRPDEDSECAAPVPTAKPLPDDFEMEVHCVSANDFLKASKIKPGTDGPPSAFEDPADTNIPSLRASVHKTTAAARRDATRSVLAASSDLVDEIKLCMSDTGNVTVNTGAECQRILHEELSRFRAEASQICARVPHGLHQQVDAVLKPLVAVGKDKGQAAVLSTVDSWGKGEPYRTKDGTTGALKFPTYDATVRRDGVYVSPKAGNVDLNQELCEPVEKAFMVGWERIMNSSTQQLLGQCETNLKQAAAEVVTRISTRIVSQPSIAHEQLKQAYSTALRTVATLIGEAMRSVREFADSQQKEINRSLLPQIQERMKAGYQAGKSVPRGPGTFARLKEAITSHAQTSMSSMFDDATAELLGQVSALIGALHVKTAAIHDTVAKKLDQLYSVCWANSSSEDIMHAEQQRRLNEQAIHVMRPLREKLDAMMERAGISRAMPDVEMSDAPAPQAQERVEAARQGGVVHELQGGGDENRRPAQKRPADTACTRKAGSDLFKSAGEKRPRREGETSPRPP